MKRRAIVAALCVGFMLGGFWWLTKPSKLDEMKGITRTLPAEPDSLAVDDLTIQLRRLSISSQHQANGELDSNNTISVPAAPPVGTRLANALQDLRLLADIGNPALNCRLALELMLCSDNGDPPVRMLEGLVTNIADMSGSPQGMMVDAVALTIGRSEERTQHCDGVELLDEGEIEERLRRAAEHGSVRQRVLYALRTPEGLISRLNPQAGMTMVRSDLSMVSQFYADHALEYLHQGMAAFDPLALEGLIQVYAPTRFNRPENLPIWIPNPVGFAVLTGIYSNLGTLPELNPNYDQMRVQVMAEIGTQAALEVEKLVQRQTGLWMKKGRIKPAPTLEVSTTAALCE